MNAFAGFLESANVQLTLAAATGMVCVMALAVGVRSLFGRPDELAERLDRVRRDALGLGAGIRSAARADGGAAADAGASGSVMVMLLRPLARLARPSRSEELSRIVLALVRAGYRRAHAIEIFLGLKMLLAPLFTVLFLEANAQMPRPLALPLAVSAAVWVCAVTFFAPNLWLRRKIGQRQLAIERALPDGMDLLVTCVEAGLGLDAAIGRVAGELALAAPILAEELNLTSLEVQAGITRAESFRRLAERTGVEELRSLSAMLIQTDVFGTSIARALRVHSEGMRTKRMQRAEEKAAMVSVKMTVPLVLCILPALVAVVMGPGIVTIMQSFKGQ